MNVGVTEFTNCFGAGFGSFIKQFLITSKMKYYPRKAVLYNSVIKMD